MKVIETSIKSFYTFQSDLHDKCMIFESMLFLEVLYYFFAVYQQYSPKMFVFPILLYVSSMNFFQALRDSHPLQYKSTIQIIYTQQKENLHIYKIFQLIIILTVGQNNFMKNRLTYIRNDVLKGSQESYTVDTSLNLSKQLTHSPRGKITQRLSSSPFNLPLKNAIDQLQKTKNETQLSRNSYGCASIKHNPPSHHRRFSISQNRNYENIHSQTYAFLQKYFSLTSLDIPVNPFIQNVLIQYAGLWGSENTHKVQKGFSIVAKRLLGNKSIKIPHLIELTSQDGMIGLVLTIFREMKSEQNQEDQLNSISSITFSNNYQDNFWNDSFYRIQKQLKQWMQSMFKNLENQFIFLLNKQLKRIIIKIKESQTILSHINGKIAENNDILSLEKQIRALKVKNDNIESKKQKLEQQIQKTLWKLDKSQKQREYFKNKYENAQIKFQKIETFLINSAFYKNNDVPSNPPIEIKISTHFITQTTTPFTTKK